MPTETEPKTQSDKFRDLARQLECDEDEDRFEEAVRRVAKRPVAPPCEDQET
jgi:hypothetical protein